MNASEDKYKALIAQALGEIKKLKSQLQESDASRNEPIAIVGIGCRIPGDANSAAAFWQLLCEGRDTVAEMPGDRYDVDRYYDADPAKPGKILTRCGSFLTDIKGFDAEFFGIAPREAMRLDPQQRQLLEVSWEALEHAAIDPTSLNRSATGVFVGVTWDDYLRILNTLPAEDLDSYALFGTTKAGAAGRLSHFYGFQGPCLSVDTACSSSLVSVHLACMSLRRRESNLALAAGVNLIMAPQTTISASRARMISADGRCKTFSSEANGFGRSEGVGVVVLQRLADAKAQNNRIIALIRATASNQDGHTSGLTVPNGLAQQSLLEQALREARLKPADIQYLEAHGTGTSLGDPIEIEAIDAIYGQGRMQPLIVASVKTNLGHAEGAAGIIGLIKLALSLHHREIPRHLHFRTPNPLIAWDRIKIEIPMEHRSWPCEGPRYGALSSFGFTGTNAHAILEEGPAFALAAPPNQRPVQPLCLSARSDVALSQLAQAYIERLGQPDTDLSGVCANAALGRAHFPQRLLASAANASEMQNVLREFIATRPNPAYATGSVWKKNQTGLVMLFTGQGSQYVGMGRGLLEAEPMFRESMEHCDQLLQPILGVSLLAEIYGADASEESLSQTRLTQPALFAFEVSLAKLLRTWGIRPDVVLGHSVGEYAAAWMAGVFNLDDGLRLIAARGALMEGLPETGEMYSVFAAADELRPLLLPYRDNVSIAALNGPAHTVISGRASSLAQILEQLGARRIKAKQLKVSHAFHSPLMAPMLEAFRAVAREIKFNEPQLEFISNLSGKPAGKEVACADYWVEHITNEVRFAPSLTRLIEQGYQHFLEIGPKPILTALAKQCSDREQLAFWPALRGRGADHAELLATLAQIYCAGHPILWQGLFPAGRRAIELPSYPFQHQSFWTAPSIHTTSLARVSPYPGRRLALPFSRQSVFEAELNANFPFFLADHKVSGTILVAAGSHLCAVLAAAGNTPGDAVTLEEIQFTSPLVMPALGEIRQQIVIDSEAPRKSFRLASLGVSGDPQHAEAWRTHMLGTISASVQAAVDLDLDKLRQGMTRYLSLAQFAELWPVGYQRGPAFLWLDALQQGDGEVLARVHAPAMALDFSVYPVFPGLLDACFQAIAACVPAGSLTVGERLHVPCALARLSLHRPIPTEELCCYAKLLHHSAESIEGDILLCNLKGQILLELRGLRTAPIHPSVLSDREADTPFYRLEWQPAAPAAPARDSGAKWLVLGDGQGLGPALLEYLRAKDHSCEHITATAWAEGSQTQMPQNLDHIVFNLALEPGDNDARLNGSLGGLLRLVQTLVADKRERQPLVWVTTRQAEGPDTLSVDPIGAALWGFCRSLLLEHPELNVVCIDLDAHPDHDLKQLEDAFSHGPEEPQVAYRKGQRYLARLSPCAISGQGSTLGAESCYLITGGLGGLGLTVAAHLVSKGARKLVLTGRSAPSPMANAKIEGMIKAGATIQIERVDISAEEEVAALFARLGQDSPVRGIIHAAGVLDDGMVSQLSYERFRTVLAAKADGSRWLDTYGPAELDFFVAFSSLAGVLGSAGQANYAAANAYMDAVMRRRRLRGARATSIAWGPWEEAGMAAGLSEHQQQRLAHAGIESLDNVRACQLLDQLINSPQAFVAVLPVEWDTYARHLPSARARLVLEGLVSPQVESHALWPQQLLDQPLHKRRNLLRSELSQLTSAVLGLVPDEKLRFDRSLFDMGMDSLTAVEFRNEVANRLGKNIKASLVFDHPSLDEMLGYLCEKHLAACFITEVEEPLPATTHHDQEVQEQLSEQEAEALLLAELDQLDY